MKRKLSFLALFCLLLVGFTARAQGQLEYEFDEHDFGTIVEGTQATFVFRVRNNGDKPVVISEVQASCGCTTPDWTKTPLLPGKIGYVRTVYNSTGRPGPFSKAVTVTSTAATPTHVLHIKGEVLAADKKTNYTAEQKRLSPRLAVGSTSYSFGKLEKGQKAIATFRIRNAGLQDLVVQGVRTACNCVSYHISEPAIKAGQIGMLELTYTPGMLKEQNEQVTVLSNDIVMPNLRLTLKANVMEKQAP